MSDDDVPFDPGGDNTDRVADARRRHGLAGAMLAAGMLGLDQFLSNKKKEDAPIVIGADSEPIDIDTDGIRMRISDDAEVVSHPLPRTPPLTTPSSRSRRRRR